MAFPSVTYTFTNGTTADGTQVNQNFTDLVNGVSDGTKSLNISALTLGSTLTANGSVVLGASSGNSITVNGSIGSSIAYASNTLYDIGGATLGIRSLYVGGGSSFTVRLLGGSMSSSMTLTLPTALPASTGVIGVTSGGVLSCTITPTVTSLTLTAGGAVLSASADTATNALLNQPLQMTTGNAVLASFSTLSLAVQTKLNANARPIVVSPAPATHGLMVIRGQVVHQAGNGACSVVGEGFTASRTGSGTYVVTFNPVFLDAPGIGLTQCSDTQGVVYTKGFPTTSGFTYQCLTLGGGTQDTDTAFVAVGQRAS
jgi:hypothetical protein